jgi:hypothetical protein
MSADDTSHTRSPSQSLKSNARGQLLMLLVQFLAGMAVNLIGMPSETRGFPRFATSVLLALHVLVAIGLLVGAIRAIPQCSRIEAPATGLAWWGLTAVVVTFAAGVLTLTMSTGTGWWSYVMAAGAAGSLLVYGLLYLRSIR